MNREALWQALLNDEIDFVVSDHSPCTVELKRLEDGDFMKAWGGIGGLGLGLSLLWTEASKRKIGMDRVIKWVCERPAKQVGLQASKGSIQVGGDADLVFFDPALHFQVSAQAILTCAFACSRVSSAGRQVRTPLQEPIKSIRFVL